MDSYRAANDLIGERRRLNLHFAMSCNGLATSFTVSALVPRSGNDPIGAGGADYFPRLVNASSARVGGIVELHETVRPDAGVHHDRQRDERQRHIPAPEWIGWCRGHGRPGDLGGALSLSSLGGH
jgi:hypothetical protein